MTTNSVEGYFSSLQTRHARRLSALRRKALASLSWPNTISVNHRSTWHNDGERAALAVKGAAASVSRIEMLTRPDFSFQAKRFLRWRRNNLSGSLSFGLPFLFGALAWNVFHWPWRRGKCTTQGRLKSLIGLFFRVFVRLSIHANIARRLGRSSCPCQMSNAHN